MTILRLNDKFIHTLDELKALLGQPIDSTSRLAQQLFEATYGSILQQWLVERYPEEQRLIQALQQLEEEPILPISELVEKVIVLVTEHRVTIVKPPFDHHARLLKVERCLDVAEKRYNSWVLRIEVFQPINEYYDFELKDLETNSILSQRQVSLDVEPGVKEITVTVENLLAEVDISIFIDGKAYAMTKPKPQPIRTYQVGDYYDDGKKRGVVFEVDASGQHGKMVSLVQSKEELRWCTEEEYDREVQTGATDPANGLYNQRSIERIEGWRNKYPAFAWCADLGEGWYLPAIEELEKFLLDYAVHNKVNRTLQARGATKLFDRGEVLRYWSSTEKDKICAWGVIMGYGGTRDYAKNLNLNYVRAVSAF